RCRRIPLVESGFFVFVQQRIANPPTSQPFPRQRGISSADPADYIPRTSRFNGIAPPGARGGLHATRGGHRRPTREDVVPVTDDDALVGRRGRRERGEARIRK